ncbi:MAG: DUF4160 domain-containing protein [bacterium]
MHVHVECEDGEAKYWVEPVVALAIHYRLNTKKLNEIQRKDEIIKEWKRHFSKR